MGPEKISIGRIFPKHREGETEVEGFGVDLQTVLEFVSDETPDCFAEERSAARRLIEAMRSGRVLVFFDPSV